MIDLWHVKVDVSIILRSQPSLHPLHVVKDLACAWDVVSSSQDTLEADQRGLNRAELRFHLGVVGLGLVFEVLIHELVIPMDLLLLLSR